MSAHTLRRVALVVWVLVGSPAPLWAQDLAVPEPAQPMAWLSELISQSGLWAGLLAAFVGGLALNLTPCVYPMIPVTLAFFSSQAAGAIRRRFGLAVCYVAGISISYATLGVMAAKTGTLLGSWLQRPSVLIGVAAVIVVLSLSMFGVYELRPPHAITRRLGEASSGLAGAFLMGLVLGIVAAPCVGPFVLGLLLVVNQMANPAKGFLLFLMLGLGMGLPYLALALATDQINRLPKAGGWLLWSKKALGLVLWGLALYLVRPLLPSWLLVVAVAALLLGAGIYLGWLERGGGRGRVFRRLRWLTGIALILGAGVVTWPRQHEAAAVAWVPYDEVAFEQARRQGQPILIDIYADWCIPCVEMDHVTFRNPEVVKALASVATFRLDATREVSAEGQRLLDRYDVFGVPTVLLFDRRGNERKGLRLSGFVTPKEFLERLAKIQ